MTNNNRLKRAVAAMFDLELNNYLMEQTINNLSVEANSLCVRTHITKPEYKEPVKVKNSSSNSEASIIVCMLLGLLGDYVFSSYKTSMTDTSLPGIETIFRMIIWAIPFELGGMLLCFVWEIISSLVTSISDSKAHKQSIERAKENYLKSIDDYNQSLKNEDQRMAQEKIQRDSLNADIKRLNVDLEKSRNILNRLYDYYKILPQYRNIIAVGYMNDLLMIGAATQLEGDRQLYEKVRSDLRDDRLLEAINGVSYKLDTLIDSTNRLYGILSRITQVQRSLCGDIVEEAKVGRRQYIDGFTEKDISNSLRSYEDKRIRREEEYRRLLVTC